MTWEKLEVALAQQDVITRFWSTHIMIESIICLKEPLMNLMNHFPDDCRLNADDWATIITLHGVLKPFMVAQKTFERGGVTNSFVIPLIYDLRRKLTQVATPATSSLLGASPLAVAHRQVC